MECYICEQISQGIDVPNKFLNAVMLQQVKVNYDINFNYLGIN